MRARNPILAGGAAAVVMAGAAALFPPMRDTASPEELAGKQFAQAENAFAEALRGSPLGIARIDRFGLQAGRVDSADSAVLLSEAGDDCRGRGVYWINADASTALAITAPHRGSDRYTGTLAATLFVETDARAAGWNSAPRRPNKACANAVDLARAKDHVFSAFTLGFAKAFPDGLVVQLHGFEGVRREKLAAQEAAIILSNGTDRPSERLLDLADDLSIAFTPLEVLVFPIGTGELGATGNAQGQLLREAGFAGFVHIEMSAQLRAALIEDSELRAKLADALVRAAR